MIAIRRQTYTPPENVRTAAQPLYAVGDVHGCYDLFRALLQEISRDAGARSPDAVPLIILCGDYIDRGPDSAKVMSAIVWLLRSTAVDVRALEGNHEAILRLFLDDPAGHGDWLRFGGRETLESYGVTVPADAELSAATLVTLRDALLDAMPLSHDLVLRGLEPYVQLGDYLFVHAGVRPGVPLDRQVRDDLLWIREDFLDDAAPADAIVVHGHTWEDDLPVLLPHRLGIDTGAYETGVLTAVRIDNGQVDVIQAVRR
ncbi:metallophosphoesterase [Sphingomonas floccifaciens]|uniref:Metallophosphoesterase n=1 Tax=Sphingomonas floccifaciens TaxID=1844115 RepID=A0ABW4NA21_9SPHN